MGRRRGVPDPLGSVRSELELPLNEEFDLYRGVVRELYKRVNDTQSCYE